MDENTNKPESEIKVECKVGNIDKVSNIHKTRIHGCIITIIVFLMIYVVAIIVCNEKVSVLREVLITTGFATIITIIDRIVQLKREELEFKKEQNDFICKAISSLTSETIKAELLKEIIKE